MNDKRLEKETQATEEFLEYWQKLSDLYKNALAQEKISKVNDEIFLCSKDMVSHKFENWMDLLCLSTKERVTRAYCFYEIFSIKEMHGFSDEKMKQIFDAWQSSFLFISGRLDRAKKKKKRLENINGFFYKVKKIFTRGGKS
jgi:hypothetical protein